MRIAYADPPYVGQSHLYKEHPDYAGEVDHDALIDEIDTFDGFVLHASLPSLHSLLDITRDREIKVRIIAWVKPWCSFKPGVRPAYAWEPVLVKAARKPLANQPDGSVMRDWVSANMTMGKGLAGVKPALLCQYLFAVVGAEPGDELVDMFPGSGAVTKAWRSWRGDYVEPGTLFETA